jgi:hypothetical protein
MKRILYVISLVLGISLSFVSGYSATEITVDHVDGLIGVDAVRVGSPVRFVCRLTYTPGDGSAIIGLTNGFKVWTYRNGAYTDSFSPIVFDTLPISWADFFDGGTFLEPYGVDGTGTDTAAFSSFLGFTPGFVDGFDSLVWWIETVPYQSGDTLCIDSVTTYPSNNQWLWATSGPAGSFPPDWGGPYCFHVEACCMGNRGNVDMEVHSGSPVDVADLVLLKYYLFEGGETPPCMGAGDVNGSGNVNVADLTYLIDYLFRGGPEPPPCP